MMAETQFDIVGLLTKRHNLNAEEQQALDDIVAQLNNVSAENRDLNERVETLTRQLQERKLVNRAKGVLMRQGLSEPEAYRRMQKAAMNSGRTIIAIAEAVLLVADVSQGNAQKTGCGTDQLTTLLVADVSQGNAQKTGCNTDQLTALSAADVSQGNAQKTGCNTDQLTALSAADVSQGGVRQ